MAVAIGPAGPDLYPYSKKSVISVSMPIYRSVTLRYRRPFVHQLSHPSAYPVFLWVLRHIMRVLSESDSLYLAIPGAGPNHDKAQAYLFETNVVSRLRVPTALKRSEHLNYFLSSITFPTDEKFWFNGWIQTAVCCFPCNPTIPLSLTEDRNACTEFVDVEIALIDNHIYYTGDIREFRSNINSEVNRIVSSFL